MRFFYIINILIILSAGGLAQEQKNSKVEWDGYTQLRFTSNFNDVNSFAMRRMKLWVNSAPGFNDHWGFHVQTTITSYQNEKFFLQDVMTYYKKGQFRINLGQFVPHYSLQRFQSDAVIPLTERASVINALIPNGTLGVRDIGVEGNYTGSNKNIETWFGIFNGYGIKEYLINNKGILLTNKTAFQLFNNSITSGYSAMYRKSDNLEITTVLPDTVRITGDDFRFNLFAQYIIDKFNMQIEYLWASLNSEIADGWYVLANVNIEKHQIVASYNQYNDLVESTVNAPEFHLGYNYLAKGNKLKCMIDNSIKIINGELRDYYTTIQLQLFFN
ncbi:MAG: hypothetical protein Kow0068_19010 [Marinilabiliales bacterium]